MQQRTQWAVDTPGVVREGEHSLMKGAGVCGVGVQITIHSLVSLTLHQLAELPVTAVGARRRMMVRASRALTTNAPCTRMVS
tara:strand:- start:464 stop:709 length:246 start_codon:yes stop_codon:yes gene_type:complete